MSYEPHLITPFVNSGLSQYFKPFNIGNTAFPKLENAYAWRGSVKKREGYKLFKSLPAADKPVQGITTWINPASLANTSVVFSLTKAYYYNSGTAAYENISFLAGGPGTAFSFGNGANDYFWTTNFAGSLWVTNGLRRVIATEPAIEKGIMFWNGIPGSLGVSGGWSNHQPKVNDPGGGNETYLNGCVILIPYKGRLVALNTLEGKQDGTTTPQQTFSNRARWCQLGTPYLQTSATYVPPPPFDTPGAPDNDSWRSDIPGRGGFIDADTSERIVSAAIVRDTLIVFFQRSTWRLTYTGDQILPFIWERLNTNYGSESTFSSISFDEAILTFSRFGWIGSTTNDVQRVDQDIPDQSFSVEAADGSFTGLNRVQGIRDYYRQMAYWTFPPLAEDKATEIYAYNYIDKNWSLFKPTDPIRVFGNYYSNDDVVWSSLSKATDIWKAFDDPEDNVWENLGTAQNFGFPFILGGDADGNLFQMFEFNGNVSDTDNNAVFNFDITTKRLNPYLQEGHKCRLGYVDIYASTAIGGQITVNHFVDDMGTSIFSRKVNLYPVGVYVITSITPGVTTTIITADANNVTVGEAVNISGIVGSVGDILNNTAPIAIAINIVTNEITFNVDTTGTAYVEGGYIWCKEQVWTGSANYKRVYLGAIGHMHQLQITLSKDQLLDTNAGTATPEIQALVLWTRRQGLIRG